VSFCISFLAKDIELSSCIYWSFVLPLSIQLITQVLIVLFVLLMFIFLNSLHILNNNFLLDEYLKDFLPFFRLSLQSDNCVFNVQKLFIG
jgi:hypothetical protein